MSEFLVQGGNIGVNPAARAAQGQAALLQLLDDVDQWPLQLLPLNEGLHSRAQFGAERLDRGLVGAVADPCAHIDGRQERRSKVGAEALLLVDEYLAALVLDQQMALVG